MFKNVEEMRDYNSICEEIKESNSSKFLDQMLELYKNDNYIKLLIASNVNTSVDTLQQLAKDQDIEVKNFANKNLANK